jgi:hypothetical protein
MLSHNDGTRTLIESTISIDVIDVLTNLQPTIKDNCVLIGNLAVSFYVRPRFTDQLELLCLEEISQLPCANQNVELILSTPQLINMSPEMATAIFKTANVNSGIRIASPSGLVAAKLLRLSYQDKADIEQLAKVCKIDLTPFPLTTEQLQEFDKLKP